ncbi:MAG: DUF3866 family protein, partial [Candidatus Nanopelagicales bacterium]
VSHHSVTAYGRVALVPADVPAPELPDADLPDGFAELVRTQVAPLTRRHHVVFVDVEGLMAALVNCPVPLSTMGRGLGEDPAAFLASAAAGRHAASLLAK